MSRISNLISKCIWPPVDWSESPRIRAVLPGKWQYIHPSPLPPRKRKFHIYTEHYQFKNFINLFLLQPLENCEEAIHGEWKTNRHRGKIFRAFAGLKANMTQIKSEILLYKIKEAYFWQPLAESASKIYPGWRMRIYHNITEEDHMVLKSQFLFPKLFFFNLLICLLNFVVHSMQSTQCFSPKKK